jgi:hypothetical protein
MKDLKSISLAITMLICFVALGQEKDSIKNLKPPEKGRYCMGCPKDGKELIIIVDGLRINKKILSKISSNNTESIKILKYEKAKLLYSDCGIVGAMIIETKNLSRKEKRYIKRQSKIELQIQEYRKNKTSNLKN